MLKRVAPYLALLALALVVRAKYLGNPISSQFPPGRTETERAALSLARKGELGNVFAEDSGPSAHLAPFYPWLLGQLYRLAGWMGTAPRPYQETLVTLLTCLGITLIPLLALRAKLCPGSGWLAALLLSLLPGNRFFETSGCHEQPLISVGLTLLLLAFIRLHERRWRSPLWVLLTALLIGMASLLGPLFPAIVALVVFSESLLLRTHRRVVLTGALVIACVTALVLFPWASRNHRELGEWVWMRSNFGLELWIGNNPDATGQTYFPRFAELHPFGNPREVSEYKRLGELVYMRQKENAARAWIAANPGGFARLLAARVRWFWFPSKSMVWWDGKKWVAHVYSISTLGMLAGLLWLFRIRHTYRWLFLATLVGFALPYLITHVDVRYRYPLSGLCTLLACDGVVRAVLWLRRSWANGHLESRGVPVPARQAAVFPRVA